MKRRRPRGSATRAWLCCFSNQPSFKQLQIFPRLDSSRAPASFHFELGRRLGPLRAEGVLMAASGNLVHNLRAYDWGGERRGPYGWAARFERQARGLIEAGQFQPLVEYAGLGSDAALAIPTPDHYLPLLYVLGASQPGDPVAFPVEGVDGGSVSMLAVRVGA